MAEVNIRRVLLGGLAGGVVWAGWSTVVNMVILKEKFVFAQANFALLVDSRIPDAAFITLWIITLFVLSFIGSWLYASVRETRGAGPGTALLIGIMLGFAAGFPVNFSLATHSTLGRAIPFWWMMDLGLGAIVSTFIAGWLYAD